MKKVSVIIPTTGSKELHTALDSLGKQTYNTKTLIVIDGPEYRHKAEQIIVEHNLYHKQVVTLPENVGANGFYGHRIYAGFSHLVNSDYVLFLDQDCYYEPNHIESMVNTIESNNSDWCYSLRKIVDVAGNYICNDDCESLGKWNPLVGYNHVDTNCYCIRQDVLIKVAHVIHGKWGSDRIFYDALSRYFTNYDCTGEYTVNYRLGGNEGSVKSEFFLHGNQIVSEQYKNNFPWRK